MKELIINRNNTVYKIAKGYDIQKQIYVLGIEKETPEENIFVSVKVVNDNKYTYKIQKTQIKAHGGIDGLLKHFNYCITNNIAIDCWVIDPIEKIISLRS